MDLTLLSLSIKGFGFEFEFSPKGLARKAHLLCLLVQQKAVGDRKRHLLLSQRVRDEAIVLYKLLAVPGFSCDFFGLQTHEGRVLNGQSLFKLVRIPVE